MIPFVYAEEIEWVVGHDIIDKDSRCYPEPFEGCALPENFSCSGLGDGRCIGNDGEIYYMVDLSNLDKNGKEILESKISDFDLMLIIVFGSLSVFFSAIWILVLKGKFDQKESQSFTGVMQK